MLVNKQCAITRRCREVLILIVAFSLARPSRCSFADVSADVAVEQLLRAIARNDQSAIAKLWISKGPQSGNLREVQSMHAAILQYVNGQSRGLKCVSLHLADMEVKLMGPNPRFPVYGASAHFQGISADGRKCGSPKYFKIGAICAQGSGTWRVQSFLDLDAFLAEVLVRAPSAASRGQLLVDNRNFVDRDTLRIIRPRVFEATKLRDFPRAHLYAIVTLEIAKFISDQTQVADAYVADGIVYLEEKKHSDSVASFKHAIEIFHAVGDEQAVGAALINYSNPILASGHPALAIEMLLTATSILQRARSKKQSMAWHALALAWERIGDHAQTLAAYQKYYRHVDKREATTETLISALMHIWKEALYAGEQPTALWAAARIREQAGAAKDAELFQSMDEFIARQQRLLEEESAPGVEAEAP